MRKGWLPSVTSPHLLNTTAVQQMLKHALIFKHVSILTVICSLASLIHVTLGLLIGVINVSSYHVHEQKNRIEVVVMPNFRFCG